MEQQVSDASAVALALQSFLMIALVGALFSLLMAMGLVDIGAGDSSVGAGGLEPHSLLIDLHGRSLAEDMASGVTLALGGFMAFYAQAEGNSAMRRAAAKRMNIVACLL